jgi:flagellin-specific chaperone FliS
MYKMIENTLTQMNLINKPKELTLVIQLVFRFLAK